MNYRAHDNEDALLDRLVDGELSADKRREVLASLERQPEGWRRCALAFLEAQAWRSEIRDLVDSAGPTNPNGASVVPLATAAATNHGGQSANRYGGLWLAAAAALLLAFGLGRQFGVSERADLREAQLAQSPAPAQPREAPQFDRSGDAVTLVVNNERGVPQRLRVPLVEGRHLGRDFADAPQWSSSPELARRLRDEGLGLTARRRYLPMHFEQENQTIPMIVPVDDAIVTPVSRPVY